MKRDLWDWLVIASTVFAAGGVWFAISQWRRHPEVEIEWSLNGNAWSASDSHTMAVDDKAKIEIHLHNVGDATGEATITNFIAADCFSLQDTKRPENKSIPSGNRRAGKLTEHQVTYLKAERRFFPDLHWGFEYELQLKKLVEGTHEILFQVDDERFNSSGKRWLPSRTYSLKPDSGKASQCRWIRSLPKGEIECRMNSRMSVRQCRVEGTNPAPPGEEKGA